MESETITDRLLREDREARERQQQLSRELAKFLESSIDYATPKVLTPIVEALERAVGKPATIEPVVSTPGRRKFRVAAHSKSGVEATVTALIIGQGPIVDNPQDVNFVHNIELDLHIPGRARRVTPINPFRQGSVQPILSADFVTSTIETTLAEMLRGSQT
jgi:hypothetical protein